MRPLITRPLTRFLQTESAGGVLLVAAAVAALVWANSPWGDGYGSFWHGDGVLGLDRRHVVNDGLMALFFLDVGLEVKRELVTGERRDRRAAALPAIAAIGGVVVSAAIYAAFNAGGPGSSGWGIAMATDIAIAVGVLARLGSRVPGPLKPFLLALAIVDDIIATAVIAVFYAEGVDLLVLLAAAATIAASVALRRVGIGRTPVHVALLVAAWWFTHESGAHATIAGVAFALATPVADGEGWEQRLHSVTSFVIVPLFALANAGVALEASAPDGAGPSAVAAGAAVGLVVGKPVGITLATWLAVRTGLASLPADVGWTSMIGAAALAGIGFTVSLFIADLAFDDVALQDAAKPAVLVASVVASAIGAGVLAMTKDTADA